MKVQEAYDLRCSYISKLNKFYVLEVYTQPDAANVSLN